MVKARIDTLGIIYILLIIILIIYLIKLWLQP